MSRCGTEEVLPEEEGLDPRIQEELEKLNEFTNLINALESQLDEGNCAFSRLLSESSGSLQALSSKLGSSTIEKARPFYAALEVSQKAQKDCHTAVTNYQRAAGIHSAAKETITLAEQRFLSKSGEWKFDEAWQAMLNNATIKVVEAECLKTQSRADHLAKAASFTQAESTVQSLEKSLHKFIQKSKPYFQRKDQFDKELEEQKKKVQTLQKKVSGAKESYAASLRKLEAISESIHARRKVAQLREPGVGAESQANNNEESRR
ncbi:SH3 domain-binding protein 5 homolog,SH3 domain-binding protein 5-like,SH3 domain-binding protein 5 [Lepeophtheirus salmonis]|uniref:SH3 domain-binding protein 5 homolog,SH3 domain-binding protein 5-like,SH3 domain-binding protein 5 n=1 Tax=Lepeophtheirus salmonis TaxID=72036 RepID=A0A7R8CV12_LEPSM|nr:SH3 domain-binding protein 5 homolog,SH3 domain-binding protein 5-like,SH3 domain-binding protein 5 [Lepeophtheirus salmonis]CAF2903743.1 SH3 domain-binding protein 5 homolog,SH3 domain-binding protein 5-like,SH3 domain-binding protein 5 [Lepeophtheirus salmonis]